MSHNKHDSGSPGHMGEGSRNLPCIRPLRHPQDAQALAMLDTSYQTDHVLDVCVSEQGADLLSRPVSPPFRKHFPLTCGSDDHGLSRLAEVDGRIVAFAAAHVKVWNQRAELRHLYVAPDFRGTGLGARLLEQVQEWAVIQGMRGIWLETQNTNPGAIRFYQRQGFHLCGLDTSLYDPAGPAGGEVALFYYKPLDGAGPPPDSNAHKAS